MRLKRVRLFGFKTFADRTEFDLEGGIVAVVGPNGCGKSNLVDAILWCLGETNARHLRAATGQDVIFGGSARRKAVGYAEVSLLFDNEDGALPIPTSEVTLTRRLTAGGDSTYGINREPCRLRDVQELLADSGLGRAGYAIVGQREIEGALAASADERRAWIDEAAGVQRYRARKFEANRRLGGAAEHLARVDDLVRELGAQEEPLRRESSRAVEYRRMQGALQSVEVGLLANELRLARDEIEGGRAANAEAEARLAAENDRAALAERESAELRAALRENETEGAAARDALAGAGADLARIGGDARVLEERARSRGDRATLLDAEIVQRGAEFEEAARLAVTAEEDAKRARADFAKAEGGRAPLDTARKAAESAAREAERALGAARERNETIRRRAAQESVRAERLATLMEERAVLVGELAALRRQAEETASGEQAAKRTLDDAVAEREAIHGQEAALASERRTAERAASERAREIATLQGRRRAIEATIESHEGAAQGAKAVLDAAARGELPDVYCLVGASVEAEREVALAVETALGGAANDLVVPRGEDAKRAIEHLKARRLGRATFQPLDLVRGVEPSPELLRLRGERGVVGIAADLVRYDREIEGAVRSLLGRILIVETLDDGLRLGKSRGFSRLVSLDGEVVNASGAVTGGVGKRESYGLVQRRADLTTIEGDLRRLEAETPEIDFGDREAEIAVRRGEVVARVRDAEAGLRAAAGEAARGRVGLVEAERRASALDREIAASTPRLEKDEAETDLAPLQAARDEAAATLARIGAEISSLAASLTPLREATSRAEGARDAAVRRVSAVEGALRGAERRRREIEDEAVRSETDAESVRLAEAGAFVAKTEAEARIANADSRRRMMEAAAGEIAKRASEARATAAAISAAAHAAEIVRLRAETRRATAVERLMDVYALTEEEALAQEHEVPPDAPTLVARLRREIKGLGEVNLGAIEAYARLDERLGELRAQSEDVRLSIAEIERGIAELDELTRERFLTAFERVAALFTEEFLKMFGGGEGQLRLSDPGQILESGVDVDVQLPGKRKGPLSLLSGGERSLCALAFLFALLRVRPSPLVVLDEVDAPLDGRNVERFAAALTELSASLQFIVITHNRATIEAAPTWLGVTMQEPGVSTLAPVRLTALA